METTIGLTERAQLQMSTDLQEYRDLVGSAHLSVLTAREVAGMDGLDLGNAGEHIERAIDLLAKSREPVSRLVRSLNDAQVIVPVRKRPEGHGDELANLSTYGSDDSRELLAALEHAQKIAERIDAARGLTVGDKVALQPGESSGTDLAATIAVLALRARREAFGGESRHE